MSSGFDNIWVFRRHSGETFSWACKVIDLAALGF
jgi:hypothetical protein